MWKTFWTAKKSKKRASAGGPSSILGRPGGMCEARGRDREGVIRGLGLDFEDDQFGLRHLRWGGGERRAQSAGRPSFRQWLENFIPKIFPNPLQTSPNPPQTLPKLSPNPPQTLPKPSQNAPESIKNWNFEKRAKKIDFGRQKQAQHSNSGSSKPSQNPNKRVLKINCFLECFLNWFFGVFWWFWLPKRRVWEVIFRWNLVSIAKAPIQ